MRVRGYEVDVPRFSWAFLRELAMILIFVALLVQNHGIRGEQEAGQQRGLATRVVACWTNKALAQPYVENDPCRAEDVKEILDELPIVLVGTGDDHHVTQVLICEAIRLRGDASDGAAEICAKLGVQIRTAEDSGG